MNVFANAMVVLFADQNLSVPALYTPAGGGPTVSLRAIIADPGKEITGLGALSASASALTADVLIADVPDKPRRGATLETSAASFKIGECRPDGRGLRWRMALTNG
jgi:hypothetical protein